MSKKTQLVIRWEPSVETGGTERFDWEDLDVENEDEWNALTDEDRRQRMADAISDRDHHCYLCYAAAVSATIQPAKQ